MTCKVTIFARFFQKSLYAKYHNRPEKRGTGVVASAGSGFPGIHQRASGKIILCSLQIFSCMLKKKYYLCSPLKKGKCLPGW